MAQIYTERIRYRSTLIMVYRVVIKIGIKPLQLLITLYCEQMFQRNRISSFDPMIYRSLTGYEILCVTCNRERSKK